MTNPEPALILRSLSLTDVVDALGAGIRDFRASPVLGLSLGGLYAAAGWLIFALVTSLGMSYLAYPMATGFALIAPFAAVGFYAMSDQLQKGERPTASSIAAAIRDAARRDLRWMAMVTGFGLIIWMDIAAVLYFGFWGFERLGAEFVQMLLTTPAGLLFLLIGNTAGALIAIAIFSISAVSFPLLYDRDIDFVTAMTTSVKVMLASPVAMLAWCLIIAVLTGLSILSAFAGLFVVLPVIGHATWHLYRRAVASEAA